MGAHISCSGTRHPRAFEGAREVMKTLWHVLDVTPAGELLVSGVDARGEIGRRPEARAEVEDIGRRLARQEGRDKEET